MPHKRDKDRIRLDYAALGDNVAKDGPIPLELVKKAQGMLGRQAREQILQMMDSAVRVQAAEAAQRQMNPLELYKVGQEAILEAIKHYRVGQDEMFREFATAFARQSMAMARSKKVSDPTSLAQPPLRNELLRPKQDPPPKPE
jgi:hypothetical protein